MAKNKSKIITQQSTIVQQLACPMCTWDKYAVCGHITPSTHHDEDMRLAWRVYIQLVQTESWYDKLQPCFVL